MTIKDYSQSCRIASIFIVAVAFSSVSYWIQVVQPDWVTFLVSICILIATYLILFVGLPRLVTGLNQRQLNADLSKRIVQADNSFSQLYSLFVKFYGLDFSTFKFEAKTMGLKIP